MNRQTFLILVGGFLAALMVALVMQSVLGGKEKTKILNEEPKIEILVASKDLSIGKTLENDDMMWQSWPKSSVFAGAITKDSLELEEGEQPIEGLLKRGVAKGEPLLKSALVKEEKGNFVAATLGDGMRAMAIRVKAESSVGGFVTPGDFVDVIMTYDVKIPRDPSIQAAANTAVSKKAAQTVLENIRVVAVDQKAKEMEETSVARTVTLEVTATQAEELALANAMGALSLALRKLGDTETSANKAPVTDVRMSTLMQELMGNGDSDAGQSTTVQIYNGGEIQTIRVPSHKGGNQ